MRGVTRATPVAIVMTSFEPGGTERQMIELVGRLNPSRWAVHLACFHARGAWFPRVAGRVKSVATFPVTSFARPDVLRHLCDFSRWCRAEKIAIVHTTELYSNIFALPGAAFAGVRARIGSRRGMNNDRSAAHLALQRAAYRCAHLVVANSQAAAARLTLERVPDEKVAVIPNGLDLSVFKGRTYDRLPRRVAMVANLRAGKGHDVLIEASVEILRSVPDATFELIGDGAERGRLERQAEARGVLGAFTFAGHQENVAARLAEADLFVLPSRSEAFPNAVLEGMGAGLPIVASDVGGIPEIISHEATGLLVPPGDAAALARSVVRLMRMPALASRLGRAARADAEQRFSFDRMVGAFETCYAAALGGRTAADESAQRLAS
jgi:glycosyltransferase involved in cell wall biosynthesis